MRLSGFVQLRRGIGEHLGDMGPGEVKVYVYCLTQANYAGKHKGELHRSISDIADDLTNDKDSKDGIERDLFPLTMQQQKNKIFKLAGRETYRGREVYKIEFKPKKATWTENGVPWAGEALIDVEKLQPVLVTTHLAKGFPTWAKVIFGTNISQLGFKVTYDEFEDDLWFPVT